MSRPNAQALQEIKARLDLAEVVRRYVDLRMVGGRWVGPCPFHHETKPSFNVHPEQGFFYCFGCQAKGDLFDFYSRINGLEFKDCVEQLAREAGVKLHEGSDDPEEDKRRALRKACSAMHALADEYFRLTLRSPQGSPARDYIERRELDPAVVERFGLGYSLDEWQALADFLHGKGYAPEQAAVAGLLSRSEKGRCYDRFRGRLMFPIQNLAGQVVAFGGRILGDGDPKYLNTSDSPIYKKGDHLYGLHQARPVLARIKTALLTEGYMDVITLHQFGYEQAVGVLGTALTTEQIKRLAGFCTRVDLVFDGDEAGRKAALRSSELLLCQGLDCRVVLLPDGEDIDSLLHKQGRDAFDALLKEAQGGLDFCMATVRASGSARQITDWARGLMRGLRDPAWRAFYIPRLSSGLGLAEAELRRALMEAKPGLAPQKPENEAPAPPAPTPSGLDRRNDREILRFALRYPSRRGYMAEAGCMALLATDWGRSLWEKLANAPVGDIVSGLDAADAKFVAESLQIASMSDDEAQAEWENFHEVIRRRLATMHLKNELTPAVRQAQDKGNFEEADALLKAIADSLGREEE